MLVRPWTNVDELVGQLAQDNEAQTNHPHSLSPQPYIATYDTIVFSIPVVRPYLQGSTHVYVHAFIGPDNSEWLSTWNKRPTFGDQNHPDGIMTHSHHSSLVAILHEDASFYHV